MKTLLLCLVLTFLSFNIFAKSEGLKDAGTYTDQGLNAITTGNLDKAIVDLDKAIQLDPQRGAAYINRGIAYQLKGDMAQALNNYTRAIELKYKLDVVYTNRGILYQQQKNLDQAIEDFNQAIAANPEYGWAYYNRAISYFHKGNLKLSVEDLQKAREFEKGDAKIDPRFVEALQIKYYNKAIDENLNGKSDEAIKFYTKIIENINPQFTDAYINRGNIYGRNADFPKALEDYSKAIIIDPRNAEAYFNRAMVYAKQSSYDQAKADINKAQSLGKTIAPEILEELKKLSEKK